MNQEEKDLFLELCAFRNSNAERIKELLDADASSAEVLGMLFANRMAGVAYHVLKKTETLDRVDREFRNAIRNAALLNEKINEDYLGCVKNVTAELEACGVPYALLKGAYLCHWYPVGCRTSNDIDVLLSPEDVGKVSTRLKLAGFRQGYLKNGVFVPATRQQIIESKMTRGETVPFIKETRLPFVKYIEVDLNFSLDYKNSDDEALKEMLHRTQLISVGTTQIRTLDSHDFLLHLCAHLYKEATTVPWIRMKRDMTFYKYCDIYALLTDFTEDDLERLYKRAVTLHVQHELLYCLNSIKYLFREHISDKLSDLKIETDLDFAEVIAPTEMKTYRYTEKDVTKRFFHKNRFELMKEVAE